MKPQKGLLIEFITRVIYTLSALVYRYYDFVQFLGRKGSNNSEIAVVLVYRQNRPKAKTPNSSHFFSKKCKKSVATNSEGMVHNILHNVVHITVAFGRGGPKRLWHLPWAPNGPLTPLLQNGGPKSPHTIGKLVSAPKY